MNPLWAPPLPQAVSLQWHQEKYAQPGEFVPDDSRRRVAWALAAAESPRDRRAWESRFLWALRAGLLPGGRIMAGAGTGGAACLMNCFVLPVLPVQDLADRLRRTLSAGGGVGLDFSVLDQPLWPVLRSCEAVAAELDRRHPSTGCRPRPGARRAAQMAVLRFDHPQVDAFIAAKADPAHDAHPHFTFTVSLDDATMRRLTGPVPGDAAASAAEQARWHRLAHAVWRSGEPGLLFTDAVRRDDNLGDLETLSATNPCGEQPLPNHGACALASIDLTRVIQQPLQPQAHVAWGLLHALIEVGVRLLDNALDLSAWPLPAQAQRQREQRRIGLGITGLADALALLGLRHGAPEAVAFTLGLGRFLSHAAYRASVRLARTRGCFPVFDAQAVLHGHHRAHRLPSDLRQAIRRHGLRHSHLLAVAPAASISMAYADAVSPGVEPIAGWLQQRRWHDPDGRAWEAVVLDPAWRRWVRQVGSGRPLPSCMATLEMIGPHEQLAQVAALAPSIDGGISKTVSLPPQASVDAVRVLLEHAWSVGLKGITAFRRGSREPVVTSFDPTAPNSHTVESPSVGRLNHAAQATDESQRPLGPPGGPDGRHHRGPGRTAGCPCAAGSDLGCAAGPCGVGGCPGLVGPTDR